MDKPSGDYLYLADRPNLIPVLAGWFFDEWGLHNPDLSLATIERRLNNRLNRDKAPLVIVHIKNESPIASASIKIQEMETHPQYRYWLGSVYVLPEYRGQGLGSGLIRHTIGEARQLGVDKLYLYTRKKEHFYSRFGWESIETPVYHERKVIIMKHNLPQ